MSLHVPAWKRLGLKLKYANESATRPEEHIGNAAHDEKVTLLIKPNGKRRLEVDGGKPGLASSPPKRARLTSDLPKSHNDRTTEANSTINAPAQTVTRKKSVTFTSDTKIDDGQTATIQSATPQSSDPGVSKPRRKDKRPRSEKIRHSVPVMSGKQNSAKTYLLQHYSDRTSWKFNKSKEVWILKHAFSTEDLPQETNAALANYIHGLKSTGARKRLREQCAEKRNGSTSLPNGHRTSNSDLEDQFITALTRGQLSVHENESEGLSNWIKDQLRPVIILLALGESLQDLPARDRAKDGKDKAERNVQHSEDGIRPRIKRNKARTSRIDIDTDSPSESESSSSSSDDHDATSSEETSTSGSDSSSSGSDGD